MRMPECQSVSGVCEEMSQLPFRTDQEERRLVLNQEKLAESSRDDLAPPLLLVSVGAHIGTNAYTRAHTYTCTRHTTPRNATPRHAT